MANDASYSAVVAQRCILGDLLVIESCFRRAEDEVLSNTENTHVGERRFG